MSKEASDIKQNEFPDWLVDTSAHKKLAEEKNNESTVKEDKEKVNLNNLSDDIDMAWDSVFTNNYEETRTNKKDTPIERDNITTPDKEMLTNYNSNQNKMITLSPVILPKKPKNKLPKLNIGKNQNTNIKASFMDDEEDYEDDFDEYY